jgi:glycosyltransferase involved in cell wall biosynthesis
MNTLHYAGFQPEAQGFGWATCNRYLRGALGHHFTLTDGAADVVFMPLVDHSFNPASGARGEVNLAYTFFESPLEPAAVANAKKYDTVFCGSSWCLDRMWERGIHNAKVLIQGVDHSVFKPGPRKADGKFRVFSGGKFEWRKGQDLVIRAFAQFAKKHPDAHLVCAWHNPWFGLTVEALHRSGLAIPAQNFSSQEEAFAAILEANGIPRHQFTVLPQLAHEQLAAEMQNTDYGLFPNRCEGGTNLVLMEYAACGKRVAANLKTGHRDIAEAVSVLINAKEDENRWAVSTPEDVLSALEIAYTSRWRGDFTGPQWTWEAAAFTVANEVARINVERYRPA